MTVQRKLVYHQITGPAEPFSSIPGNPKLSANGNRVAFTLPPGGTGDPARPNRIFVMNPDGTGLKQVDAYTSLVFAGSNLDISADGSKVVSTDSVQLRVCNGDGSGFTPLIALDSNEINDVAISGDGTKVFFRIYRSTSIRNSNPIVPIQNGVYVINVNGTGLRQIAGPSQLSTLLGVPADQFGFFGNGQSFSSLRSSHDGSKIVFSASVGAGQRLFGVNLSGSGLRDYFGQLKYLQQSTISADGTKVGYTITPLAGVTDEVGTINFLGGGRRKLVDSTQQLPGTGGSFYLSRLQLTADGSKLLICSSGMLYNTDGSGAVPLGLSSNAPSKLAADGLEQATMNSDATKLIYLVFTDGIGFNVMARLDVNPSSLGGAPNLTKPSASPDVLYKGNVSSSTLSVHTASPVTEVGSRFILPSGLPSGGFEPASGILNDSGLRGDVPADGIFSTNDLFAGSTAPLGERIVRLKTEITDAAGRRHATAIDFTPLSIANSPGLSVNNASVTEGDSGTTSLNFTVKLSSASKVPTTVNYNTFNDTAIAPSDYVSTSGSLTFDPGQTSKFITIPVAGDTLDEINEKLLLNLFGPTNAVIVAGQATGTIIDNDAPPIVAVNSPSKLEGSASAPGKVLITTTLSSPSSKIVKVNYNTTNGTAVAGSDYVARGGVVTFSPGEVKKSIIVQFIGDALVENNETFFLSLSSPTNSTLAAMQGVVTILNDDAAASLASAGTGTLGLMDASPPAPEHFGRWINPTSKTTRNLADYVSMALAVSVPKTVQVTGASATVTAKITTRSGIESIAAKANGNATTRITGNNPYQIYISHISLETTELTIVATDKTGMKTRRTVNIQKNPVAVMAGYFPPGDAR